MFDNEERVRAFRLVMLVGELSKAHGTLIKIYKSAYDLDYQDSELVKKAKEMIEEINTFNSHLLLAADANLAEPSQGNDHLQTIPDTKGEA